MHGTFRNIHLTYNMRERAKRASAQKPQVPSTHVLTEGRLTKQNEQ